MIIMISSTRSSTMVLIWLPHQAPVAETRLWRWLDWMMSLPPNRDSGTGPSFSLHTGVSPNRKVGKMTKSIFCDCRSNTCPTVGGVFTSRFLWRFPSGNVNQVVAEAKTCLQPVNFGSEIAETDCMWNQQQATATSCCSTSSSSWFFK